MTQETNMAIESSFKTMMGVLKSYITSQYENMELDRRNMKNYVENKPMSERLNKIIDFDNKLKENPRYLATEENAQLKKANDLVNSIIKTDVYEDLNLTSQQAMALVQHVAEFSLTDDMNGRDSYEKLCDKICSDKSLGLTDDQVYHLTCNPELVSILDPEGYAEADTLRRNLELRDLGYSTEDIDSFYANGHLDRADEIIERYHAFGSYGSDAQRAAFMTVYNDVDISRAFENITKKTEDTYIVDNSGIKHSYSLPQRELPSMEGVVNRHAKKESSRNIDEESDWPTQLDEVPTQLDEVVLNHIYETESPRTIGKQLAVYENEGHNGRDVIAQQRMTVVDKLDMVHGKRLSDEVFHQPDVTDCEMEDVKIEDIVEKEGAMAPADTSVVDKVSPRKIASTVQELTSSIVTPSMQSSMQLG